MIFKFRLLSDEVKDFVRDFEVRAEQTFYDFHKSIQDEFGYDSSQIASFFLTSASWDKEREFTLFDMSDGENNTTVPMDKAILKNFITDPKQRLLYVYDFFNDRAFFIELIETKKELEYTDYPMVTFAKGNPPHQILFSNKDLGSFTEDESGIIDFEADYDENLGSEFGSEFGSDAPEGFSEENEEFPTDE